MTDCTITGEWEGDRLVLRLAGVFDRAAAWALRERVEADTSSELVADFSLVRDFSDLGVAVLANGLQGSTHRLLFRGLRQHQLRILSYCGVHVEEAGGRDAIVGGAAMPPPGAEQRV